MIRTLQIMDLHAGHEGKEILKGINLTVRQGEVHAIMGPNGSGKSTLSNVIMGHPKYQVMSGDIKLDGESITSSRRTRGRRRACSWAYTRWKSRA